MDSAWLATGDGDGLVSVWDAASGQRRVWFLNDGGSDDITAICFTGDGEGLLVAAESAATIAIWNLKDTRRAGVCHGHEAPIRNLAISIDGLRFSSIAPGEVLRVWTLEDFPVSSAPTIALPHPSSAGLRPQRVVVPDLPGLDPVFVDRAPGTRVFGRLRGHAAVTSVLSRGLGHAEQFTDRERETDALVRESPLNAFQTLRDLNYVPPDEIVSR
jgi:WD40 repeat protein